jgi:hypothetical protein
MLARSSLGLHFAYALKETAHARFTQGGVSTCGICNLFIVPSQKSRVPPEENVCGSGLLFQIWKVTIPFLFPMKLTFKASLVKKTLNLLEHINVQQLKP